MKRTKWTWERQMLDSDLPSTVKLVLLALNCYTTSKGDAVWPSYQTLAKDTSLARETVIRKIQEAEELGWVEVERRNFKSCLFTFTTPDVKGSDSRSLVTHDHRVVTDDHPPSDSRSPKHTNEHTNEHTLSIKGQSQNYDDPVDLLQEHCSSTIPLIFADMIRKTVTDYERWAAVIWQAQESKWNLSNVRALLDVYEKHEQPNGKNTRKNGNSARNVDPDQLAESGRRTLAMLQQLGYD